MWKLPRPRWSARDSFRACVRSVADQGLRVRLQNAEAIVVQASDDYENAATQTLLHTLQPHNQVNGNVTAAEMSGLYTLRMAKKGRGGRAVYDELLLAPQHGRCPLCGQRTVSTLDHHLPKATYPSLVVTPLNLVPSCSDCNKAKLSVVPATGEEETIHPYFDDIDDHTWLDADVVEVAPAAVVFKITPPPQWSALLTARVIRHYKLLGLPRLYASHAAEELVSIRAQIRMLHQAAGAAAVQEHCAARADSFAAVRRNSWQVATYNALAASPWYCDGGFAAT